jgi:hypothetical protein
MKNQVARGFGFAALAFGFVSDFGFGISDLGAQLCLNSLKPICWSLVPALVVMQPHS